MNKNSNNFIFPLGEDLIPPFRNQHHMLPLGTRIIGTNNRKMIFPLQHLPGGFQLQNGLDREHHPRLHFHGRAVALVADHGRHVQQLPHAVSGEVLGN
jgi:hypothetical protein